MPNQKIMSYSDLNKWNNEGVEFPKEYKGKEFMDLFIYIIRDTAASG